MMALIYLILAACVGDVFCRRFYQFESVAHRCAAAILTGLLIGSWFTYLAGLAFFWTSRPLVWANLLFFTAAIAVLSWPRWKRRIVKPRTATLRERRADLYLPRPRGSSMADWLLITAYVLLVSWMMFASFTTKGSKLQIANPEYSDFGPNTALMQSFAVGRNFPTEYPHYSGDRIRYHFLFYFQAGNLECLGLDPAWSLNLLSIMTLVAMLVAVMTLGEVLFNSRAVGRLGSVLFFFFGSLSYIPFLQKQPSVRAAIQAIKNQREYLQTIFPYRGEAWGTWSQVTYLNQRHFASAIGIPLLVLVFLVIRYRAVASEQSRRGSRLIADVAASLRRGPRAFLPLTSRRQSAVATVSPVHETASADAPSAQPDVLSNTGLDPTAAAVPATDTIAVSQSAASSPAALTETQEQPIVTSERFGATVPGFIFSGVLLGLLPMWNSAVFIAAAAVLGVLFILCPQRLQMLALAVTAGLIALPQMLFLSTGAGKSICGNAIN